MIVSFTGHRQPALGGYKIPNQIYNYVCQETERLLVELKPAFCISGMSTGYDQWAANIALKLGIKLVAAVPFKGQEAIWPEQAKQDYFTLLKQAYKIIIVSDGGYSSKKMQIRNELMVDYADEIIACYGDAPFGGTYNCIQYAKSKNKVIHIIDPRKANGTHST